MRVIAGKAKGRRFDAPKGDSTRPTADRVKEAIFGMIQFRVAGSRVLDLFSGSGSLGIEAASRGAASVVLNDMSRDCKRLISDNLAKLGFNDGVEVLAYEHAAALKLLHGRGAQFDLIFLDPPYATGLIASSLELISSLDLLSEDGLIVVEHAWNRAFEIPAALCVLKEARRYGDVAVTILERSRTA